MATKNAFELIHVPSNIIRGNVIDSFTLTSANFIEPGKDDLAAQEPLFWDRAFIDLQGKSKLYIFISINLAGNHVQIGLKLFTFYQNPPKQMGNVEVNLNAGVSSNPHTTKFQSPLSSPLSDYYVSSPRNFRTMQPPSSYHSPSSSR